ncbi:MULTISPECIES: hypothetical protein [Burkholderia]|uniref:Type III secretion system (T3SS) protein HrpB7 n=1 Tax=Burkholderia pyrrocinia TaxID=60550 RepID=A0A318HU55_BURPY|nr:MULTISPECIES: hypothetical protein [Burkholderia]PXX21939.1 type III secretion system (T3SS) protein HrpB7 [Burkholderia pyrrocinia]SFW89886.1 type III secretion protein (HrpB7) [Burkholderia sp. NFACC33-1]SFY46352.1 type III secretion protein (HrpB7) [Burkholderia sp. NFPP32]
MTHVKRRLVALECARLRLARCDDRLRKRLAALMEERNTIEQACDEPRARIREVDTALGREQSRIDALTRDGEPFSIDVWMQANRCIDSLVQKRSALAANLDRLIDALSTNDHEIVRVRQEAAMNRFRDTLHAEKIDVIRSEMAVHHEKRVDEEVEELALMRRVAAGRHNE